MVTKFEAIGISVSIAVMAVALFMLEHDGAGAGESARSSQSAAVVVVDESNADSAGALEDALAASYGGKGLTKLVIDDVAIGTGREATVGEVVAVHYIGRLENGQEFDNSYTRGEPISFTLGEHEVIEGWEQGILGMKVGGKRTLVIPASLAYGDRNVGPIPAGSTLLFSVELVSIQN